MKKLVSFVVPVYNEEENLHEFHKRMSSVMEALPYDYELIFVDDGSADSSHLILAQLAEQDKHVQVYFLSRNYGHQLAGWTTRTATPLLLWTAICSTRPSLCRSF